MRIKIKKCNHLRFYLLLALLIVLLLVRYTLQIDIPRIVLTAVIAIIAISGSREEILAIAMCCIPLHEAVDLYYSIGACMAAFVIKNPKRVCINPTVFVVLTMIIWEIFHCFEMGFSIKLFFVTLVPLVFLTLILCIDVSDIDYGFVTRIMGILTVTVCITLLANLVVKANYNFLIAFANLKRLGTVSEEQTMIGGTINPNSLGIICVLVISACLQLRSVEKNKKKDLLLMIVLLTFGALTASRTFVVCLLIMVTLLVIGQRGRIEKKLSFFLSMIIFSGAALFILYFLFPDLMEYYIGRFKIEDITTGRDTLMQVYHRYIINNPKIMFWGIGLNNYAEKLTGIYQVANNVPHNSVQEIIVIWGIPGLVMIDLLVVVMIINSKKYSDRHVILNYIPLLIILAKSMAGQLLTSSYTMLALSFAYLSLCQNFRQSINLKKTLYH